MVSRVISGWQQVYTIVVNGVALHVTQLSAGHLHTCALVAVEASDLARCWRDEVVRQGRMLSRLDGEMCEALAGADGERALAQDHAQRWQRLHGRPDSESA